MVSALATTGCATTMRRPPSPADSVRAIAHLDRVLEGHAQLAARRDPAFVALLSVMPPGLPDVTLDGAKVDAQFARATLNELSQIDVQALEQDDYVSWQTLSWDLEALGGRPLFFWADPGGLWPSASVLTDAARLLRDHPFDTEQQGEHFIALLRSLDTLLAEMRVVLDERAQRNVLIPRPALPRVIAHIRSFIAPPDRSPFVVPGVPLAVLDSTWQHRIARTATDVILTQVNPSLERLAAHLEGEYASRAPTAIGLGQYPGGALHYQALLRLHTTLDISPTDAHALGLREVGRIAALASIVRARTDLPVDRDSLRNALRFDPRYDLVGDGSGEAPERILASAIAEQYNDTFQGLDSLFGRLGSLLLTIGVVDPRDTAFVSRAVHASPSMRDPTGHYAINPSLMVRRSKVTLPAMVFEDLMPGGHYQNMIQRRNDKLPAFRRVASHAGYVRGWQTYVLPVADSLSGGSDPVRTFGVRLHELAQACGLVIDTGINAFGWRREEALAFLRSYLPFDDDELDRAFIVPAIEQPGLLAAGTLGAREIHGMRVWAERELGDRFNLSAFHAEVLRVGSVPLPVLGTHFERWIWESKYAVSSAREGNPPPP